MYMKKLPLPSSLRKMIGSELSQSPIAIQLTFLSPLPLDAAMHISNPVAVSFRVFSGAMPLVTALSA